MAKKELPPDTISGPESSYLIPLLGLVILIVLG